MMPEQQVLRGPCLMASGGICFMWDVEPPVRRPIVFPLFLISRWRRRAFIPMVLGRSRGMLYRSTQSRARITPTPLVLDKSSGKATNTLCSSVLLRLQMNRESICYGLCRLHGQRIWTENGQSMINRRFRLNSRLRTPLCISSHPIGRGFSLPTILGWTTMVNTQKASGCTGARI